MTMKKEDEDHYDDKDDDDDDDVVKKMMMNKFHLDHQSSQTRPGMVLNRIDNVCIL